MTGNKLKQEYVSDKQILLLIDILKSYNTIKYDIEFCESIDLLKQNLVKIRNRKNHFTPYHIRNIIVNFKVNANWIFGVSDDIFTGHKNGHTNKNISKETSVSQ